MAPIVLFEICSDEAFNLRQSGRLLVKAYFSSSIYFLKYVPNSGSPGVRGGITSRKPYVIIVVLLMKYNVCRSEASD